jgi:putative CocE/NonD family hydrolase
MIVDKDVRVRMRDGVELVVDVFRPDTQEKVPALLAISPYSKDIQSLPLPSGLGKAMEYGSVEAGDPKQIVDGGYAQVIPDPRGIGKSDGIFYNWYSDQEARDGYDLVEWAAAQPWCNGNVGMVGVSYFAVIQYLVAAQQPPHLKAIYPYDGWGDTYRDVMYHGGIPSIFGFRMYAGTVANEAVSIAKQTYTEHELKSLIQRLIDDESTNYKMSPGIVATLMAKDTRHVSLDYIVFREDGPFYWERSPRTRNHLIEVPTYLASELHSYTTSMHLPGATTWGWEQITAPKKLTLLPWQSTKPGGPAERPYDQWHDEIFRWFDHWLKGVDTGIMSEPPVKIWVRGAEHWITSDEWPLLGRTQWTKLFLRAGGGLSQSAPDGDEPVDTLHYKTALPVFGPPLSPKPDILAYETEPFESDWQVVGPLVLNLNAALTSGDGDFLVQVRDVNPDGTSACLTRGWLKASHREVDAAQSKPWRPFHPHTNPQPVPEGQVLTYAIEVQPIANVFMAGHRLRLEIWPCDWMNPKEEYDWTLFWGYTQHIPYGKDMDYEIHHSARFQSHLLVPVVSGM